MDRKTHDRAAWDRLLTSKRPDHGLEHAAASGELEALFPELHKLVGFGGGDSGHKDLWEHTKIVVRQTESRVLPRWAALFHDCGKPQCFSQESGEITFRGHEVVSAAIFRKAAQRSELFHDREITHISDVIRLLGKVEQYDPTWTDTAVRRLAKELGDRTADVLAVARADCTSKHRERRREARARSRALGLRFAEIVKQDAIPPLLPRGLGDLVMERLGFSAVMTPVQRSEMKRVMGALKAMVEEGKLPRSGDLQSYMEALSGLLSR